MGDGGCRCSGCHFFGYIDSRSDPFKEYFSIVNLETGDRPDRVDLIIRAPLFNFYQLIPRYDLLEYASIQGQLFLIVRDLLEMFNFLLGMLLIQILNLIYCLLVSHPKILDQLSHVVNFALESLILRFDHQNFFLFAQFLLNQQLFPLFLLLQFQSHLSIFENFVQFCTLVILITFTTVLGIFLRIQGRILLCHLV